MTFKELEEHIVNIYKVHNIDDYDILDIMNKFSIYFDFLVEENKKYNLTAITDLEEVISKHFYDSLLLAYKVNLNNLYLIDVGTGAGFPGVPLKIIFKNLKLVLCEPTLKRCNFLKELLNKLNILDVNILNRRAEDLIEYKSKFDFVISRAVSHLSILLELEIPLLKLNGRLIAYKGKSFEQEITESKKAFRELNASIIEKHIFFLDNEDNMRCLIEISKDKETPNKYPRVYSLIKSKPLRNF